MVAYWDHTASASIWSPCSLYLELPAFPDMAEGLKNLILPEQPGNPYSVFIAFRAENFTMCSAEWSLTLISTSSGSTDNSGISSVEHNPKKGLFFPRDTTPLSFSEHADEIPGGRVGKGEVLAVHSSERVWLEHPPYCCDWGSEANRGPSYLALLLSFAFRMLQDQPCCGFILAQIHLSRASTGIKAEAQKGERVGNQKAWAAGGATV